MTEISNFLDGMKFLRVARVQLVFFLKPMPEITTPEAIKGNEKISRGLCSNNFSPMKLLYRKVAGIHIILLSRSKTFIQSNVYLCVYFEMIFGTLREICELY